MIRVSRYLSNINNKPINCSAIIVFFMLASFGATLHALDEFWIHTFVGAPLSVTYPQFVEDEVDVLSDNFGKLKEVSYDFEIGVYTKAPNIIPCWLFGFSFFSKFTTIYKTSNGEERVRAEASLGIISIDAMYYPSEKEGKGVFYRMGAGSLFQFISGESTFNSNKKEKTAAMEDISIMGGIGYAWPMVDGKFSISIEMKFQIIYAAWEEAGSSQLNGSTAKALSLGIGLLF